MSSSVTCAAPAAEDDGGRRLHCQSGGLQGPRTVFCNERGAMHRGTSRSFRNQHHSPLSNALLVPKTSPQQRSSVNSSGGTPQSFSEAAQFKANPERAYGKEHHRGCGPDTATNVDKNMCLVRLPAPNQFALGVWPDSQERQELRPDEGELRCVTSFYQLLPLIKKILKKHNVLTTSSGHPQTP